MIHEMVMTTPVGKLKVVEENNFITGLTMLEINNLQDADVISKFVDPDDSSGAIELLITAQKQLEEYFAGKRRVFTLPLKPKGTKFQENVWNALLDIPYGETKSYKEIAIEVGNEQASRAVGMANNRNPIMILIPCHRVIGSNGSMVGYGAGISVKEYLLKLECEPNVGKGPFNK